MLEIIVGIKNMDSSIDGGAIMTIYSFFIYLFLWIMFFGVILEIQILLQKNLQTANSVNGY